MNEHPYRVGDRVNVKKYGSTYLATIVATTRTRVTVRFTTKAGATKEQTLDSYATKNDVRRSY